jgi:uncharacterized DUF497 family protein
MQVAGFDWDDGNWPKCGKHGVARHEIEQLFAGMVSVIPAPARSGSEQRLIAIGLNSAGRTILIVFTLRERNGDQLIRPISARFVHERERRHYEKQIAGIEENPGSEE